MCKIDGTQKDMKQNKSAKLKEMCVETSEVRIQLFYSQLYSAVHFLLRYERAQVILQVFLHSLIDVA